MIRSLTGDRERVVMRSLDGIGKVSHGWAYGAAHSLCRVAARRSTISTTSKDQRLLSPQRRVIGQAEHHPALRRLGCGHGEALNRGDDPTAGRPDHRRAPVVRVRSSGCACSPTCATAASRTSSSSCVMDSKGCPRWSAMSGHRPIVQTCIIHLIRNTFRLTSRKYWDEIKRDVNRFTPRSTPLHRNRRKNLGEIVPVE